MNLRRLGFTKQDFVKRLFGTAMGIEDGERPQIKAHFQGRINLGSPFRDILEFLKDTPVFTEK